MKLLVCWHAVLGSDNNTWTQTVTSQKLGEVVSTLTSTSGLMLGGDFGLATEAEANSFTIDTQYYLWRPLRRPNRPESVPGSRRNPRPGRAGIRTRELNVPLDQAPDAHLQRLRRRREDGAGGRRFTPASQVRDPPCRRPRVSVEK
jgi:hypothetical protein